MNKTLRKHGYSLIVKYEPLIGFSLLENVDSEPFRKITGLDAPAKASLPKAAEVINTLINSKDINCAVILNFASRISELCSCNCNDVNEFFYNMFSLMGSANDIPAWYSLNNARLRSLPIPKPDHDIRRCIIESVITRIEGYNEADDEHKSDNTQLFITQTAGLFANELISIVQIARSEGLKFNEIGEAIRRYKLGIMENLWAKLDRGRIRNAEKYLSENVMGQDKAVRHVANILRRSVYNLSVPLSQKPRRFLICSDGVWEALPLEALEKYSAKDSVHDVGSSIAVCLLNLQIK